VPYYGDNIPALVEQLGYRESAAVDALRAVFWLAVGSALADRSIRAVTPATTATALDAIDPDEVPTYRALRPPFTLIGPDALLDLTARHLITGLAAGGRRPTDTTSRDAAPS
jgi:hypothetical protein